MEELGFSLLKRNSLHLDKAQWLLHFTDFLQLN